MTVDPRKQISTFFHCSQCVKELPEGQSPLEYSRLEVGWTVMGLQICCSRHEAPELEGMVEVWDKFHGKREDPAALHGAALAAAWANSNG